MQTINVIRRRTSRIRPNMRFQIDYYMLVAIIGLVAIGMLMVYSTTFDYGFRFQDDVTYYFNRQLTAAAIGVAAIFVIMQFDYHYFRKLSVPVLLATLVLLAALLFVNEVFYGATRGLYAGSYQPSEIAKLATILYIAHWLSSKGDRIKDLNYGLIPFSLITGIVCALVVRQPDLSTATLIALISFSVFFIAGADWRQFAFAGLLGGSAFVLLMFTLEHARGRFESFTAALQDPHQAHWHVQQSLVALGNGRWFGVGIGRSTQKFGPLPFAHTDGVFAIVGEEMGFVGAMLVIGLFGLLIWRGVLAAKNARDSYGSLLALGITCWIGYQALINLAVITAVIPFTGMPLPFLSYGGTSMAITLVGVGILLNVSRDAAMAKSRKPQAAVSRSAGSSNGKPQKRKTQPKPKASRPRRATQPRVRVVNFTEIQRANPNLRRRNRRTHLPGSSDSVGAD